MTVENEQISEPNGEQNPELSPDFIEALKSKFDNTDNEIGSLKRYASTLEKLQQVFSNEKPQNQKWIDPILSAALEAEKKGTPMPITTEIALEVQNLQEQLAQLIQVNKQQQQKIEKMSNPSAWQDQQMYASMDDSLLKMVNSIYPGEDNTAQYDAMVKKTTDYLKLIQQDPKDWQKFRNSKSAQQKLVQQVAKEFVPPQILRKMKTEYEQNKPYTQRDLQKAWAESEKIRDPKTKEKIQAQLRQTIIGLKLSAMSKNQRKR